MSRRRHQPAPVEAPTRDPAGEPPASDEAPETPADDPERMVAMGTPPEVSAPPAIAPTRIIVNPALRGKSSVLTRGGARCAGDEIQRGDIPEANVLDLLEHGILVRA